MRPLAPTELADYLARIGLGSRPSPDLDGVATIHRAHLLSVPFESLDIHLGRPIAIDVDSLVQKMVTGRRGGFCYENNSLLSAALEALGVKTAMLSARVARDDGTFGPEFDHMVLYAEFEGTPHLLDVGFGEGFRSPLPVDGQWHEQPVGGEYRARSDGHGLVVEHRQRGENHAGYRTDETPRQQSEFVAMCRYHQTSPDSGFTQQWTASIATLTGRVTVVRGRMIETANGERTETPIDGPAELRRVLATRLGITSVDVHRLMESAPRQ